MSSYNVIINQPESTVVAEYKRDDVFTLRESGGAYQSESALELAFIALLQEQGYEYLSINNEVDLVNNLRVQLEKLNKYKFSDVEWGQFYNNYLANSNEKIEDKTKTIQEDYIKVLISDRGSSENIYLIDKQNIHNNSLQVINQYMQDGGHHSSRYDVTVLVNGLPLVHIELKRRGVVLREAFNQIDRYQRDSFWAGESVNKSV